MAVLIVAGFSFGYYRSLAETSNQVDWGYEGEYNADQWGLLSNEFESCRIGRNQSPINLSSINNNPSRKSAEIKFNYQSSAVEVVNNGHTIVVNYGEGSSVLIDNKEYALKQFHFHTPSEHTIDNEASAMEVHFVHQNDAGEIAVVGAMINSGEENPLIARVWQAIPDGNKAHKNQKMELNAIDLLPKNKTYFSYQGSLTTPPCSEDVSWNLLLEPIEVSSPQIATFSNIFSYNARPIQSLNGRLIELRED
ncbi:MAG: carbonic anhydrase family protein [Cyanobacteria bacterium P01_C01_bin.72]